MSQIHPDGQAFPTPETEWHSSSFGLCIRDYIAIKLAAALMSHQGMNMTVDATVFFEHVYTLADAMIAVRNK